MRERTEAPKSEHETAAREAGGTGGAHGPVVAEGSVSRVLAEDGISSAQRHALARSLSAGRPSQSVQRLAAAAPRVAIQRSPLSDELAVVWTDAGKGAFFERLRHLDHTDPDLATWVDSALQGDDLWLARNLIQHGPEASWPIHLRVEREMKGWGDSRGKGAVFDLLRADNGAHASSADLTASLERVFAAGSDDLWLAERLQRHGPEAQWPADEQVVLAERQLAWDVVNGLYTAAGFQALTPDEQSRVLVYASGHTSLSEGGAVAIRAILDDPVQAADPEAFRQALSAQTGQLQLGQLRETLPETTITVDPPVAVSNHPYYSGPANALQHVVHIDDTATATAFNANTISIMEPVVPPAAAVGTLPSVAEVETMIRRLPRPSRATITRIDLNPAPNPDDAFWATQPGYAAANFTSDMTAGADGVVDVYPSVGGRTIESATETALHESGHAVSLRLWGESDLPDASGSGTTPNPTWDPWRQAMAADNFTPSGYARASVVEDFSEAWLMLLQYRGTPREGEVRTLMPERCRLLDDVMRSEGTE